MSAPADLNRILEELASGKITAAQAATLIEERESPGGQPRVDVEALYDSPPTRALPDEPGAEPTEAEAGQDAHEPTTEQGRSADDDYVMFSVQMGDMANVAGDVLKDAGDFARSAFQRLGQLASGVISETAPPHPHAAPDEEQAPPKSTGSRGVERLVLRSVGRRVRLVGDPKVGTILVEGPHTLRREGVTLEVSTEGELGLNLDSFSVVRPPRSVEDLRILGFGKELVVRVNPAIPVDAEVTGSRLTTIDVPRLGKIRVSAGAADLQGVVEVADALVQAGGAVISGPISEGRSRVRVESGNLSVRLTRGANVTIRSKTQLGRISWPGEPYGELDEYVVGNGAAKLEISVVMGRAVVRVQE